MKKKCFFLLSLVLLFTVILCSCGAEKTIVKQTNDISYAIPESWEYYETDNNNGYYDISSAAVLYYSKIEGDTGYDNSEKADVVFSGFMQGIEDNSINYELTSKKEIQIGDLMGYQYVFNDTIDDVDYINTVVYIVTPQGADVFNYSVSSYEYEKHETQIDSFINSIKPL